jgi:transformation/transcription domain-associated protein
VIQLEKYLSSFIDNSQTIYDRLSYIFQSNNWENLSDNFWIKHGLDLILSVVNFDDQIEVSEKMSKICSITKTIPEDSNDTKMNKKLTKEFEGILQNHDESFIQKYHTITIKDLILPLKLLSRESIRFSYEIWVNLFPYLWKSLDDSQRENIQKSMIKLFAREYHSKQYTTYPNVIQAILEGCYRATPIISIPSDLLKFLGKSFKVWHVVIPMLERQYEDLISKPTTLSKDIDATANILCDIYRVIGEDTMISGIIRNMKIENSTKVILSLEQQGSYKKIQEFMKPMIDQLPSPDFNLGVYTNSELMIWEDRWINSSRKLQQWDELTKYSKSIV